MKIHLKFNHDSKNVLDALDCPLTTEEINDKLNKAVRLYGENESLSSTSHLSEIIHNEIDYSVILYFATLKIKDIVTQQAIQKMFGDDNDL